MFANKGVDASTTVVNAVLRGSLSERCGSVNTCCRNYLSLLFATSLIAILAACSSGSNDGTTPFVQESQTPFPFKSLEVDKPAATAAVGTSVQFVATGIKDDDSKETLTTRVSWSVEDEAVAEIDPAGLASAIAPGRTIVTAKYTSDGRTLERSAGLTVTSEGLVSISVVAGDTAIVVGTSTPLTATGNFSDGSTQDISAAVVWQSSNDGIVAVDTSNGDAVSASGVTTGQADVTATLNGQRDTVTIVVTDAVLESIAVTPPSATISAGTTQQFTATGSYSDGSTQQLNANVSWQSSNNSVASISDDAEGGLATAVEAGTTTITATLDGISDSANLTVTGAELASIAVTPVDPTIAAGTEQQFAAVGRFSDNSTQDLTDAAVWSSSNENVASIANADGRQGLATARRQGPTTISATMNGVSGSTELTVGPQTLLSVDVTPTNPSVVSGTTQQFTATGNYSNGSTQNLTNDASWQSSNTAVASINGTGLATAAVAGSSTITASVDGLSGDTTLTVTVEELRSLEITPDAPSVTLGDTRQLIATGTYNNDSTQNITALVTWGPASSNIASVSNADDSAGLATALSVGTETVTATSGEISDSTILTVVDRVLESLTVTPDESTQPIGGEQQFIATADYNVGEPEDVTDSVEWTSTDTAIATINSGEGGPGLANAVAAGSTTIEARLDGQLGSAVFNVSPATLESISVTPIDATIANGETQQFTATGNYSEGEPQDITTLVTWATVDGAVASISSAGLAAAIEEGQTEITASLDNQQGNATLLVEVGERTLTEIRVTPVDGVVVIGSDLQYTATGVYSDEDDTEDLTGLVTWSSANDNIASISASGLALGNSADSVVISATLENVVGEATLVVNEPDAEPPTLLRVEIAPLEEAIDITDTLQFIATAVFEDDSSDSGERREDQTDAATWTTSDDTIASISDDPAEDRGLALGISEGTVTITATFEGFAAEATLEVRPEVVEPTLTGISIAPQSAEIEEGGTQPYTATANYSIGDPVQLAATDVSWISDNTEVAQFNGTDGIATGIIAGSVTITGTFEGETATASLTVIVPPVEEPVLESITIAPQSAEIEESGTQPYSATANYTIGDPVQLSATDVSWSSDNTEVAQFNGTDGVATGIIAGSVTITGTFEGESATASLTVIVPPVEEPVLESITIAPQSAEIEESGTQQYSATANYTIGDPVQLSATDVTWSSGNTEVAQFNGTDGIATGIIAGSATITGTFEGESATASLTVIEPPVEEPVLESITIAPQSAEIEEGGTQQYTATANYSIGDPVQLSATDVTWSSEDPDVADFNASDGVATGNSPAPNGVIITGAYQGAEDTARLIVNEPPPAEPTLNGISIAPQDEEIEVGENLQYSVTGNYSDESTQPIATSDVTWSSSNEDIAELVDMEGLVLGRNAGRSTIGAVYEDLPSVETEIIVIDEVPDGPDLVVSSIEAGEPSTNQDDGVDLPLSVTVTNQGSAEAAIFKIAVDYTRQNPDGTFVTAFSVPGQTDTLYPSTSGPLGAGDSISFEGTVVFSSSARELTVTVNANADSCAGEEFVESFCRVDESNENNNRSRAVEVRLP